MTEVTIPSHGGVKVNSGWCAAQGDRLEIWVFDMRTKRAEVQGYFYCGDGTVEVMLGRGEGTLGVDETAGHDWTNVRFEVDWILDEDAYESLNCIAECSRYTLTVVLWVGTFDPEPHESFVSFVEDES